MLFDPVKFGEAMAEEIRKACEPLVQRIKELDSHIHSLESKLQSFDIKVEIDTAIKAIPAPKDGKDCDMDSVKSIIASLVAEIPVPKDGADCDMKRVEQMVSDHLKTIKPAQDGKDCDMAEVERMVKAIPVQNGKDCDMAAVESLVKALVADIPRPKDGADCDMEAVEAMIDSRIKAIPIPKDGNDGLGMASAMIDRDGNLLITMTNGEAKNLGPVVGKDGLSLESFDMEYIEETHEVRLRASAGGRQKELTFPAGGITPGGYWREGTNAKALSLWSQDGSLWMATKATRTKPSTDKDGDWMIVARKGRDGQDGKAPIDPNKPVKIGQ